MPIGPCVWNVIRHSNLKLRNGLAVSTIFLNALYLPVSGNAQERDICAPLPRVFGSRRCPHAEDLPRNGKKRMLLIGADPVCSYIQPHPSRVLSRNLQLGRFVREREYERSLGCG